MDGERVDARRSSSPGPGGVASLSPATRERLLSAEVSPACVLRATSPPSEAGAPRASTPPQPPPERRGSPLSRIPQDPAPAWKCPVVDRQATAGAIGAELRERLVRGLCTVPELLAALDQEGLDVNGRDEDGHALLHFAAGYGRVPVVEALVSRAEADLEPVDKWGKVPMDWAEQARQDTAAMAIRREAARRGVELTSFTQRHYNVTREEMAQQVHEMLYKPAGLGKPVCVPPELMLHHPRPVRPAT